MIDFDILPPKRSRNPFKLWAMTNNIKETVHDRDIVAMEG